MIEFISIYLIFWQLLIPIIGKYKKFDIGERVHNGLLENEIIEIDVKNGKEITKLEFSKFTFNNQASKRKFEFLTSDELVNIILNSLKE
jgi:hypothetical protein